jgi:hypothetical protein
VAAHAIRGNDRRNARVIFGSTASVQPLKYLGSVIERKPVRHRSQQRGFEACSPRRAVIDLAYPLNHTLAKRLVGFDIDKVQQGKSGEISNTDHDQKAAE